MNEVEVLVKWIANLDTDCGCAVCPEFCGNCGGSYSNVNDCINKINEWAKNNSTNSITYKERSETRSHELPNINNLKVGDKIWSPAQGIGRVESIVNEDSYPIEVMWEDGESTTTFSPKGEEFEEGGIFNKNRLYWPGSYICKAPKPKRKVTKWLNVYPEKGECYIHVTEYEVIENVHTGCEHITIEWETEE